MTKPIVNGYKNYHNWQSKDNNCDENSVYVTRSKERADIINDKYKSEMEIYNDKFYILYK